MALPVRAACALALVLLAAGCTLDLTGATCNTNDNCPVRQFCSVPDGARQGTCRPGERFDGDACALCQPGDSPRGRNDPGRGHAQHHRRPGGTGRRPGDGPGRMERPVRKRVGHLGEQRRRHARAGPGARPGGSHAPRKPPVRREAARLVDPGGGEQRRTPAHRPGGGPPAVRPGNDGERRGDRLLQRRHRTPTSPRSWPGPAARLASSRCRTPRGAGGGSRPRRRAQASIRASYLGLVGATAVTVGAATLVGLTISPPRPRGLAGSDLPVEATGVFSDGTAQSMTGSVQWSVDDQTVGYFGRPGVVTLLSPGSTTVRAVAGAVDGAGRARRGPGRSPPSWRSPRRGRTRCSSAATSASRPSPRTRTAPSPRPRQRGARTGPALAVSPSGDLLAQSAGQSPVVATVGPLEARVGAESTADAGVSWLVWPPESVVPVGAEGMLALERTHADGDGPGPHPGCGVAGGRR